MGLHVHVFRWSLGDCTANGISSKADQLCLINVDGPFEPDEKHPAALLVAHRPFGDRKPMVRIVPADENGEAVKDWTMFGGNYAACSDSRLGEKIDELLEGQHFYGAVAIHDRIER